MSDERTLTDGDVRAIATELKIQLLTDFKLDVANGVLVWVRKAAILFLLYLAITGIVGEKSWIPSVFAGGTTK
jgi:hypothetical protein